MMTLCPGLPAVLEFFLQEQEQSILLEFFPVPACCLLGATSHQAATSA
jgi:hypothetical protein